MPFIPVPRGIQLCFNFVTAGQKWQFCITIQKDSGVVDATDLADMVTLGQGVWTSHLKPLHGTNSQFQGCTATDVSVGGGLQDVGSLINNGTGGAGSLPINTAEVVSLRTAKRGRSYRGRVYWAGIPTTYQNDPTDATSAYAIALGAAFAELGTQIDTAGMKHVVASRQHNGVTTNPAATNEVIAYIVDTHFDSQRRRLFGRGT